MKATGTGSRTGRVDIPALMEQPSERLCRWPQAGMTHLSDASACPWSAPGASCVSRSEVPTSLEAALNSPKGPGRRELSQSWNLSAFPCLHLEGQTAFAAELHCH